MTDSPPWSLHPQLEQDTETVGDLALSRLLISNDGNYPWLLLVPRRAGASELIDLEAADQRQLMTEIAMVSVALKAITACDKLNIAAIGNMVPQLHVHVVARRRDDPAWPSRYGARCRRVPGIPPHANAWWRQYAARSNLRRERPSRRPGHLATGDEIR
jgi:diadenosine tetraphosphate (Ap4A) HIT family hydrolase